MEAVVALQPLANSALCSSPTLCVIPRSWRGAPNYPLCQGKAARSTILASELWTGHFGAANAHCRWHSSAPSAHRGNRFLLSFSWRWKEDEENDQEATSEDGGAGPAKRRGDGSFDDGVNLFNEGEYYACHDVLEALWMSSNDPQRGALHGILQCAVGLYHLFNQNHKGAMLEMGEGLTKIRRLRAESGPFQEFEESMGAVLEFVYSTQLEHAACIEEYCATMDGSEESYQLLGNFGAGEPLYKLCRPDTPDGDSALRIRFNPRVGVNSGAPLTPVEVNLPVLRATSEDLYQKL
eukprot:TRINITY_DN20833_c0_g1_i1.p1 TRINITY_DN20833_c0_g1~~TRINITY_DN20833_c0_g1_i1.p1  ORF type:complete len:294 (-),score=43.47 TRINITY_DN20833_c0_g1_i1:168-1049(-)